MNLIYGILVVFVIASCVSKGPEFNLKDLRQAVNKKQNSSLFIKRWGKPNSRFQEAKFKTEFYSHRKPTYPVDSESWESEVNDDNFEKDDDVSSKNKPYQSEAVSYGQCDSVGKRLKYLSESFSATGTVEERYTMIFVDSKDIICAFKIMSIFKPI
ncbi:hypothetical protein [Pseudobacteriovorax antillogorgiicola]|uniref:Uncharacterized protein n=1 Tax=Pseudobacteriovorax antillogorgiicola TaxID=1513793 RepID=A0A1Y6CC50_9BACT|nr:hypothetical protein [Pseudobacteriovorax antillogorgiicola]TCS48333.1 hypothetical protein EDD56_118113 [Pseudobacteriovorax antillogorgiicola]SMF56457.1 hypothetical protein SAMN06296036_11828 [Pseudobacteriovorax antillogorgiicola]